MLRRALATLGRHRRLTALAVVAALGLGVLAVAAARSRTGGCASSPPVPALSDQLRALGDFDQPYGAGERRAIEDAALRVASATDSQLGATVPDDPVRVAADTAGGYDALVVPLTTNRGPNGASRSVAGLVSFLLDCSGQAYFSAVDDLARGAAGLTNSFPPSFPAPEQDRARRDLGAAAPPRLVYRDSPFAPSWKDDATGRTVPAFPRG